MGALLIAIATYFQTLCTLQQYFENPPKARATPKQIERVGNSLLNIVKRLGMWYFKREVEDLTEQLGNPVLFDKEQRDYEGIFKQDEVVLEETRIFLEILNVDR